MSSPDIVSPSITALYGIQIPTKRRAIAISQGQNATVQFQLLDYKGNPVSLGQYSAASPQGNVGAQYYEGAQYWIEGAQGPQGPFWNIQVRIRETMTTTTPPAIIECEVIDPDNGIVQFMPDDFTANNAGVYQAEFGVYKPQTAVDPNSTTAYPALAFTNKCYVWVDRGLFGDPQYPNLGPPTLDEVRMFIRDNGPEENLLLNDYEFDLAEVCQGTENAVRYWNEVNPPLDIYFTTTTYCVRHKWLQAIAAHMFMAAGHRFRRNHLPYQAGGISVDDQNKFQQYDQAGMLLMQEYKEWVKTKKVQINCMAAITTSGSAYGSFAYQLLNTGV